MGSDLERQDGGLVGTKKAGLLSEQQVVGLWLQIRTQNPQKVAFLLPNGDPEPHKLT